MKQQVRIIIGSPDTGEIFEHADMGIVEKLDLRRRQHRDGWVTEASFPSCYASAVRWLDAHGYLGEQTVNEWAVGITIGLNSIYIGPNGCPKGFGEPTKIVDATTVGGQSVRYIIKGTDKLAKRYEAWDFESDSDPQLYAFDLDVRYVLEIDETLEVGMDPMSPVDFVHPDDVICSIDSVTHPDPFEWNSL
tara:strand:- start:942 stop:1514 length:573 start_codon:yes stop_codon:yes gene_type:complete